MHATRASRLRGLVSLVAGGIAFLTLAMVSAHGAVAAPSPSRWCGGDEASSDRSPEALSGRQIHVVYATPSDGPDRFLELAPEIARGLAAIDDWWQKQDPGRTPRFDLYPFPGCDSVFGQLDLSFVRLPRSTSAYSSFSIEAFYALEGDLRSLGLSNPFKKYLVFYDGQSVDAGHCGVSDLGPPGAGDSYALVYLRPSSGTNCGALTDYMAITAAHEITHNLGAVVEPAPHRCQGAHVCDNEHDLMDPGAQGSTLYEVGLDSGHDDYYGHSGSWWDVQDSPWLWRPGAPQPTLTVAIDAGSGSGSVESYLPGIACPDACSIGWDLGSEVTLSASADADSVFVGWGGACSGAEEFCDLTLDAAKSVTARFRRLVPLSLAVRGRGGTVSFSDFPDCAGSCQWLVPEQTDVLVIAKPKRGYRVVSWGGVCTAASLRCVVQMNGPQQVSITFGRVVRRLAVSVKGQGRVVSRPAGIACRPSCRRTFGDGTVVTLKPIAAKGWSFAGWGSACAGKNACRVRMDADQRVTATFTRAKRRQAVRSRRG